MKNKHSAITNTRLTAFNILSLVEKGQFAQELIDRSLKNNDFTKKDRKLLPQLVYGTLRYKGSLDTLIKQKMSIENRIILRLAGFQLIYLDKVPHHAIVNESVELAKIVSSRKSVGFINAILRQWTSTDIKIKIPDPKSNYVKYLSVKYSFPEWLARRWLKEYAGKNTEKLCEYYNTIPEIVIRVNTLKTTPEELRKSISLLETTHPLGFILRSEDSIVELPEFKEGLFQIQDTSSMFVVDLLNIKPDMSVLDLCAAPGGKTCYIAQLMQNKGKVVAVDRTKEKVKLINDNCKRLGIDIVRTVISDGNKLQEKNFDRVIVDAPCSNTGVLNRRIEVRWRLMQSDFERLSQIQLRILESGARALKVNGMLVYSTCSIDKEENQNVVNKFLSANPNFKLQETVQKLPHIDLIDGIYAAKIVKMN